MVIPVIIPQYDLSWHTVNLLISMNEVSQYAIKPIIVDNNSNILEKNKVLDYLDTSTKFVKPIIIENTENVGFVKAVNQGIDKVLEGDYEYFFIFNNDTFVTSKWDIKMIDSLKEKDVGIVGSLSSPPNWRAYGNARMFDGKESYFDVKRQLELIAESLEVLDGTVSEVDFVAFFAVGIKTELIKKIGKLDEDYNIGLFDDDDFCYRTKKAGYKIILRKDAFIHHYQHSTFIGKNIEYDNRLAENRKIFISKHGVDPWERLKKYGTNSIKSFTGVTS